MPTQFAFFQQAMLALLGSKDISKGLVRLFEFLHSRFGLAGLTFDSFSEAEKVLKVQYVVSHKGFFAPQLELPLSAEEVKYLRHNEKKHILHLGSTLQKNTVSQRHCQILEPYIPLEPRQYMVGIMHVDGQVIGHLACLGQSIDGFTEEHVRYLRTILPACSLSFSNLLDMDEVHKQHERTLDEKGRLSREIELLTHDDMVGAQGGLRQVVEAVRQLAHGDTPVLILGETGTGKELVAAAIQKHSPRSNKPFIKVNCGALADTLLDSELFGHEKGAFTGALNTHQGRFEQADGGTLFLDEVGELSPQAQVRLLRVLQDGTFERIGGRRSFTVNVRIIAATNRDLWSRCQQGLFREDLYHRLNVFPITMPPLRQRREDIPLLIRHLTARVAKRLGIAPPEVLMEHLDKLMLYPWPGNVRELENLVERAIVLSKGGPINLEKLLPQLPGLAPQEDMLSISRQQLDLFVEAKFMEWQARIMGTGALPSLTPASAPACMPSADKALSAMAPSADALMPQTPSISHQVPAFASFAPPAHSAPFAPKDVTEDTIRLALKHCNGKVYGPGGAAERLNMNHNTLRSRMRRLGIGNGCKG